MKSNVLNMPVYAQRTLAAEKNKPEWALSLRALRALRYLRAFGANFTVVAEDEV